MKANVTNPVHQQKGNPSDAIHLAGVGLLREDRWILRSIDWTVKAGTCAAILGPNGSGKSTLARIIGAHVWPTEGHCAILGGVFGQTNLPQLRRLIRLVQAAGPYDIEPSLTARQIVLTGFFASLNLYDAPTTEQMNEAGGLLHTVGLDQVADQSYARLSSGERVRSLLARALAGRPRLLLLDEATSGLDVLGREQVLGTIQKLAASDDALTIVLITHHVEELPPITSEVLLLDDGHVAAAGKPEHVLTSEILSKVYRCAVEVKRASGRFYIQIPHPD